MTSNFSAAVTRLPFGKEATAVESAAATVALLVRKLKPEPVLETPLDWWIYVASGAGAVAVLLILSGVLYKVSDRLTLRLGY